MVDTWGLPHFFLTLTTDEVTETKWKEIDDVEDIAKLFNPKFSWRDCHVECIVLFHARLHKFLMTYIFNQNGLLGRVEHHIIRYKIQNRGSLHAHIMLWLHVDNVDNVVGEIIAHIPYTDDQRMYSINSPEMTLQ